MPAWLSCNACLFATCAIIASCAPATHASMQPGGPFHVSPPAATPGAGPSLAMSQLPAMPGEQASSGAGGAADAPQGAAPLPLNSPLLQHEPVRAAVGQRVAYTDLDAAAAAQAGVDVLNMYDFVMYQEGMHAGASAVPLPSPANTAVFVPPEAARSAAAMSAAPSVADSDPTHSVELPDTPGSVATPSATAAEPAVPLEPDTPTAVEPAMRKAPAGGDEAPPHPADEWQGKAGTTATLAQQPRRTLLGHLWALVLWLALLPLRIAADLARAAGVEVMQAVRLVVYLASWASLLVMAAPFGVLAGGMYVRNRRLKQQRWQLLRLPLNDAQLRRLLGAVPAWLEDPSAVNPTERMDWLNKLVAELWPILDPTVCQLVVSTVEPMLTQMKPPFIAAMGFKRFTLGETPVVLEGVRVTSSPTPRQAERDACARTSGSGAAAPVAGPPFNSSEKANAPLAVSEMREVASAAGVAAAGAPPGLTHSSQERIELEVDFSWAGQPNVHFFVELALAGSYTRMVPRLSSLTVAGTLKLVLAPLLPVVPGFGAAMVSFTKTPQIKFSLEFGPALGGRYTARPVAAFLDPFIRDTLANMVVWPGRVVVPLLPPEVTGPLDELQLHSVGVLAVDVLQARNLPQSDRFSGTSDPQVELWTQAQHRLRTSAKRRTTAPKWGGGEAGQRLELMVQEPDSQLLRLVVHDIDLFNIKELLQANLLKGARDVLRSSHPIGRAAIRLADICATPHQEVTRWWRLSRGDWGELEAAAGEGDDEALGDAAGEVQLRCVWRPFSDADLDPSRPFGLRGVLFVDVRSARRLPAGDTGGASDPYCLLDVARQQHRTAVVPATSEPAWNEHAEFLNVQAGDVLTLRVYDRDWLKWDDHLGELVIPLKQVLASVDVGRRGLVDGWLRLQPGNQLLGSKPRNAYVGEINVRLQYRAYE